MGREALGTLFLAATCGSVAASSEHDSVLSKIERHQGRITPQGEILIVDDNPGVLEATSELLQIRIDERAVPS
jgi:hypothetical protein